MTRQGASGWFPVSATYAPYHSPLNQSLKSYLIGSYQALGAMANHTCPAHLLNRIIQLNKKLISTGQTELTGIIGKLQSLRPDVVINSAWSADSLSHVLTLSSKAPIRICLRGDITNISQAEKDNALALYSVVGESSQQSTLEINRYRDLLIAMGGKVGSMASTYTPLAVERQDARDTIRSLGLSLDRLLVVVPQAGVGIPHREYPRIVEVVPELAKDMGLDVLALGTSKDSAVADAIVRGVGARALSLAGRTTIRQAAALISCGACALGVDTGLMHLAAAQNIPSVIIMGGGHFGRFFPHGSRTKIITNHLECFGCNWACSLPEPLCTTGIVAQEIVKTMYSLCKECGIEARPRASAREMVSVLSLLEA